MSMTPEEASDFAGRVERLVANVGQAVLGKADVIRLALTCMLTEGHLLLEDAPGETPEDLISEALRAAR